MKKSTIDRTLSELGIKPENFGAGSGSTNGVIETKGNSLVSYSPIDGRPLAKIIQASREDYEQIIENADNAFKKFRILPAPKRGGIVREIADQLRRKKEALGTLISLETGKIKSEGLGEV